MGIVTETSVLDFDRFSTGTVLVIKRPYLSFGSMAREFRLSKYN